MRLTNSTDFPNHFLRRMVSWCCKEIGLSPAEVRKVEFTKTRDLYRGRAWPWTRRILVRIGSEVGYPCTGKYPGRINAPTFTMSDRIEALVHVTAHELTHLLNYQIKRKNREAAVDAMAIRVMDSFRPQREALLAQWNEPPKEREAKPKASIVELRAVKAQRMLDGWKRKLKLAQTKVKKYTRAVRYYEKKQAAKRAD